jgi:hypothetical protein
MESIFAQNTILDPFVVLVVAVKMKAKRTFSQWRPLCVHFIHSVQERIMKLISGYETLFLVARQAVRATRPTMQQVDVGHVFKDRRNGFAIGCLASPDLAYV